MKHRAKSIIYAAWVVQLLCQACGYKGPKHKPLLKDTVAVIKERPALAVAKVPSPKMQFAADIAYGRIGTSQKGESDRAYDNIFHIVIPRLPQKNEEVFLVYELKGVADHASVCRSINDGRAVGGYFVRFAHQWRKQHDPVAGTALHTGDNVIRFSVPDSARFVYEVRNVTLLYRPCKHPNPLVIDTISTSRKGLFLVKGTVDSPGTLTCNGKQIEIQNGEFEAVFPAEPLKLELQSPNGQHWSQKIPFGALIPADTSYRQVTKGIISAGFYRKAKGLSLSSGKQGAGIRIPKGALPADERISITPLSSQDVAPLSADLVNVTGFADAYRFLPHGSHFAKPVRLTLPIDTARLPEGYTKDDIHTFYFDEKERVWTALPPDTAKIPEGFVGATSTHFTDIIAGIIKVPESPQTQGYTPTSIKDYKAGDPSAGIPVIAAPVANSMGNASMSFPIKIPKGRNGMQPNLNLNYSSDGGNGWLGLGWSMPLSFVGIDTRWGVPRYSPAQETETYLLNGEQLAPLANRTAFVPRVTDMQFHHRVEGGFERIIRHGNSPANYWWQVTNKNGVSSCYGGTPKDGAISGAVLKDASGNIAQWMLVETRDLHDNYVSYQYTQTLRTVVSGGQLQGSQIYLSAIHYTGSGHVDGKYAIKFLRDSTQRKDVEVSARLGFPMVSADLLTSIEVDDHTGKLFRSYKLSYVPGAFNKTLLNKVQEIDATTTPFYSYSFHYYNDLATAGAPLNASENWSPPSDGIRGDFPNLLPGFTDESSALNTVKNRSSGAGLTLTVGIIPPADPLPDKNNTVGGNVSHESGASDGLVSMVDINGDGLPDKVFKYGDAIYYRPNLGINSANKFGDKRPVAGLSSINTGTTSTSKSSVQIYPFIAFAGHETSTTKQTTDTYFADFNGDGLIDVAAGGQVYFNHINQNGDPEFTPSSAPTPSPIVQGALDKSFFAPDIALQHQQELDHPLEDAVRFWQAPFAGTVAITGAARLLPPAGVVSAKDDGVRLAVETNGAVAWSTSISAGDYAAKTPTGLSAMQVAAGQRIFFRVQSVYNGNDDQVQWNPLIAYQGKILPDSDANKRASNRYEASEDFILDNQSGALMPKNGTVSLEGSFNKAVTSDTVSLIVGQTVAGVAKTLFTKKYPPSAIASGALMFPAVQVNAQDVLTFTIHSDSYIDRAALSWIPHYTYTSFTDGSTAVDLSGKPLLQSAVAPNNSNYNDWHVRGPVYVAQKTQTVQVLPDISAAPDTGLVTFTIKGPDTIYAKRFLKFNNGVIIGNTDSLILAIKAGQRYYFDYACANRTLASAIPHTGAFVFRDSIDNSGSKPVIIKKREAVAASLYTNPASFTLGPLFRGWGAFQYKGDKGTAPIDESELAMNQWANYPTDPNAYTDTNAMKNLPNPTLADVTSMIADASKNVWAGTDTSVFVGQATISSSRLILHDVSVDSLMQGSGLTAASKIRKSSASSTWGGIGFILSISGSSSKSSETTQLDMMDMNGDRYPDVLNENNVQYTYPSGALEPAARAAHNLGGATGSGKSQTGGLGGGFSPAPSNNSTAGNANQVQEDAGLSIGLSGDVGKSTQTANSVWVDVNGDGLPDKLYDNGLVALNLGYTFAPPENWNIASIDKNQGSSLSGSVGINLFQGAFEAGFGLTRSAGTGSYMLADINGDGLIDQIYNDGVQLNNGNSFDAKIPWSALSQFNSNISTGESLNAAFTVPIVIGLPFLAIKICVNPSVNTGWGLSREQYQIMDIDGDGFPDVLHSENDGDLQVNRSTIGRTNLLMSVDRPLRSSFSVDYARAGNSYAMPEHKWVMKSTILVDSIGGSGADTMRYSFTYQDGFYNRREREFYGFKTVTTNELNTQARDAVYRSTAQQFLNQSYYTKGLSDVTYLQDASGNKFTASNNTYQLRTVQDSVIFPALRQTTKQYFEGQSGAPAQTTISYDYDALGNVTSIDDLGDGTASDEVTAAVTYFSVDAPYIKAIPKMITVSNQGAVKRKRTQDINTATGDITKISQFLADGTSSVYDMLYDSYGNLTRITRPANYHNDRLWYNYTYDNVVNTYVTRVDDAYGYSSTSTYDFQFGLVKSTVSLNGEPMNYVYDNNGRLLKLTGPYEVGLSDHTISFDYHHEASVPYVVTSHYDPAHSDDIRIIHFMDGFGRTIQVKKEISMFSSKAEPDKEVMTISGRVAYDAFGRVVKNYYPLTENVDPVQNNLLNTNTGTFQDSTRYDVEDRPLKATLADGSATKYAYTVSNGALLTSVTDALSHVRETLTDVRERKREDHALGGPAGPIVTKFSYDGLNELVKVEDINGNATTFAYDNLGRKISATHPDAGTTTYAYDLAGNLRQKITAQIAKLIPKGGAITYEYDRERITSINYPMQYQNKVTYQYGAPSSGDRAGRITLQEDASGGQEFFYGKLGEVIKTIRTVLISKVFYTTYVSEQTYDTWNRIRTMSYPDGEVLTYSYNKGGTLSAITGKKFGDSINYVNRIGYDEYEQRVYLKYGNNTETIYSYDPLRRRLSNLTASTASSRQFMNNAYSYDAVSNILNITNSAQAAVNKLGGYASYDYTYDGLYRLATAKGIYKGFKDTATYGLAMGYDNLYNITSKTMTDKRAANNYALNYIYGGAGPHQADSVGTDRYTYDLDGNVTAGGGRQNFWDDEDRLMAVIKNGVLSEYTYDASGERVVKSSGGVQGIWVNNAPAGTINHRDNYTVYVSPYLVCTRTAFTKHFYIESERIATQLGKGKFNNISFPQMELSAGGINYINRARQLEKEQVSYYASLGVPPGPPTNKPYYAESVNNHTASPILVDTTSAAPQGWPGNITPPTTGPPIYADTIPSRNNVKAGYGYSSKDKSAETDRYFYHPDHLGSTNYVTDINGEVSQHFEYSAFGETFFDEHSGTAVTPYLFNAKEKDDETSLYYYGARYYDSKVSTWLAVDPMQDKYAGLSPYNYTLDNPVKLIDPTGREDESAANKGRTISGGDFDAIINPGMPNERVIPGITIHPNNDKTSQSKAGTNQGEEPTTTDQTLAVYGGAAAATDNLSGIARIGSNLRFYGATANGGVFLGNQYVKTLSLSKIGKIAGITGVVAGTFIDAYGIYKGTTTWEQGGEHAVFAGIGFLGPVGAVISVGYFGLNAFYPGGAHQAASDFSNALSQQVQSLGQFNTE